MVQAGEDRLSTGGCHRLHSRHRAAGSIPRGPDDDAGSPYSSSRPRCRSRSSRCRTTKPLRQRPGSSRPSPTTSPLSMSTRPGRVPPPSATALTDPDAELPSPATVPVVSVERSPSCAPGVLCRSEGSGLEPESPPSARSPLCRWTSVTTTEGFRVGQNVAGAFEAAELQPDDARPLGASACPALARDRAPAPSARRVHHRPPRRCPAPRPPLSPLPAPRGRRRRDARRAHAPAAPTGRAIAPPALPAAVSGDSGGHGRATTRPRRSSPTAPRRPPDTRSRAPRAGESPRVAGPEARRARRGARPPRASAPLRSGHRGTLRAHRRPPGAARASALGPAQGTRGERSSRATPPRREGTTRSRVPVAPRETSAAPRPRPRPGRAGASGRLSVRAQRASCRAARRAPRRRDRGRPRKPVDRQGCSSD